MELTGKQKRYLRGLGHRLDPMVRVGQRGVTDPVVASVDQALEAHELIKIKAIEGCPYAIDEVAKELVERSHAHLVQTLGHTALLYRPRKEKPEITLPKPD